jgi:hypothetical protein
VLSELSHGKVSRGAISGGSRAGTSRTRQPVQLGVGPGWTGDSRRAQCSDRNCCAPGGDGRRSSLALPARSPEWVPCRLSPIMACPHRTLSRLRLRRPKARKLTFALYPVRAASGMSRRLLAKRIGGGLRKEALGFDEYSLLATLSAVSSILCSQFCVYVAPNAALGRLANRRRFCAVAASRNSS